MSQDEAYQWARVAAGLVSITSELELCTHEYADEDPAQLLARLAYMTCQLELTRTAAKRIIETRGGNGVKLIGDC